MSEMLAIGVPAVYIDEIAGGGRRGGNPTTGGRSSGIWTSAAG